MKTTLLEKLLEVGYQWEDVYHHESDLYVYATLQTEKIITEWCKENGYNKQHHCPIFIDQITGKKMFSCAFCYYDIPREIFNQKVIKKFNDYKEKETSLTPSEIFRDCWTITKTREIYHFLIETEEYQVERLYPYGDTILNELADFEFEYDTPQWLSWDNLYDMTKDWLTNKEYEKEDK